MVTITRKQALQFARFALVGGLNTLVDLVVFNIWGYVFGLETSVAYFIAKTVAFGAAMANSYWLNSRFTFKKERASWQRFIVITIASFLVSSAISTAAFQVLRNTTALSPVLAGNVSAVFGVGISMVANFIGYKFFVFTNK